MLGHHRHLAAGPGVSGAVTIGIWPLDQGVSGAATVGIWPVDHVCCSGITGVCPVDHVTSGVGQLGSAGGQVASA
ncbi:hypothetical protein N7U49_44580 [Streptomyces sp. AD2-2]|nr:hypothetical protein N7U49_44580 [Streptomyces sp. AD2-2]